jgi:PBSX family phage terminase large subunit
MSLVGTYVDEASTMPESFWVMLLTRLSIPGAQLYATTNPDGPQHWLLTKYLDRAALWLDRDGQTHRSDSPDALDLHRFSFQLADNPSLPAKYIADVSAEFKGLWRRRLILGEWCLAEGVIYESFDPARHVVHTLPSIARWVVLTMDYGTTNPFHALIIGLGVDGRLYVAHEWRWDSKVQHGALTDAEYSQRLRAWVATLGLAPEQIVVDPSAASFRVQLHRDGWSSFLADNDVLDGIRTTASLFATGRLLVSSACPELIKEIPSYAWDPKASEKGHDQPIKVADHGVDALRYGLHTTRALWEYQLAPISTLEAA